MFTIHAGSSAQTLGIGGESRLTINMLYTLAVVLVILWLLGLVSSVTMGGFIHVLLVIALVAVLLQVISGRRIG